MKKPLFAVFSMLLACVPAHAEFWTLSRYLSEIFAVSDDLRTAKEEVELSRNSYLSSLAAFYLPGITLSAANSPYSVFNDPKWQFRNSKTTAGASANLNLFNNFRDKLNLDSSRLNMAGLQNRLWGERQRVALEALNRYYNVLRRQLLLEVVRAGLKSYEEQYGKVRQYYKEGLKSYSDVLKSEFIYRSSQLEEAAALENYKNALMEFNFSVYRDPETEIELEAAPGQSAAALPDLESDLAYAAENRVETRLNANLLKSRELAKTAALIGRLPNLSLDAAYTRQGLGNLGKLAELTANPAYSLTLSLSLSLGPATVSRREEYLAAEINLARAERAARNQQLRIKKEVISSYLAFSTMLKKYEVSRMKADISKQNLDIVGQKYAESRAGIIELTDAQSDDLNSRNEVANALYDLLLARASYDRAVGRQLWK